MSTPEPFAVKLAQIQDEAMRLGYHQCAIGLQAAQDLYAADKDPKYRPRAVVKLGRGFTLIELLVSISVISLLIGLLLPALSGGVESGRRLHCMANLRTIGQGVVMYLDRGDGLLPYAGLSIDVSAGRSAPLGELAGVLGVPVPVWGGSVDEAVTGDPWVCPSDRSLAPVAGSSYVYIPSDFFSVFGPGSRREVTALYRRSQLSVVFLDGFPFHGRSDPGGRNALLMDGSVGRWQGSLGNLSR